MLVAMFNVVKVERVPLKSSFLAELPTLRFRTEHAAAASETAVSTQWAAQASTLSNV